MNIKIGELVEYVEVLKASHKRKVDRMGQIIHDLVSIKKELEEQADGDAQLIKNLELQVKVAEQLVKKEVAEKLRKEYGWTDQGLHAIGVLT